MFKLRWDRFETLMKRCESYFPSIRIKKSSSASSRILVPAILPPPSSAKASHCSYCNDHVVAKPTTIRDSFSNELLAYRQQSWWEPQIPVSPHDSPESSDDAVSAGSETCNAVPEPVKRSISIREIRQRMNSHLSRTSSLASSGTYEFEPGLKLLNGIRGSWEDLEMFIE